jgi:hypothetical protein
MPTAPKCSRAIRGSRRFKINSPSINDTDRLRRAMKAKTGNILAYAVGVVVFVAAGLAMRYLFAHMH